LLSSVVGPFSRYSGRIVATVCESRLRKT